MGILVADRHGRIQLTNHVQAALGGMELQVPGPAPGMQFKSLEVGHLAIDRGQGTDEHPVESQVAGIGQMLLGTSSQQMVAGRSKAPLMGVAAMLARARLTGIAHHPGGSQRAI